MEDDLNVFEKNGIRPQKIKWRTTSKQKCKLTTKKKKNGRGDANNWEKYFIDFCSCFRAFRSFIILCLFMVHLTLCSFIKQICCKWSGSKRWWWKTLIDIFLDWVIWEFLVKWDTVMNMCPIIRVCTSTFKITSYLMDIIHLSGTVSEKCLGS
jgi:hypothetical protein